MKRALGMAASVVLAATSCTAATTAVRPQQAAPGELTLRYDGSFELWSGAGKIAKGPRYAGLTDFVNCVPDARRHAEAAEASGRRSRVLAGFSIGLATGGLGGLAGLAFRDKNDGAMAAFLAGGLALEVVAIALGATSISARRDAHGNALDAVNFYNDAVGYSGSSCAAR